MEEKKIMINNINYLVTSRCNSRCTNCNMWNTKPLPELSPDQICTLFSLKEFQEVKEVGLSGGEPFIRQDMPEILEAIHRANPAIETIYITTNASFPSRVLEVCEVALKYFRNINIGVSIDGSKHVNRLIRGVDSYDSAYSLLQDLKYRYPQIHASISFTVCRANCSSEELMHIKTIAEELCCDYSFRIASEGESYYKNSGYNFSLTDEQRKMLIRFIIENKFNTYKNYC